jgi:hypothetical protein
MTSTPRDPWTADREPAPDGAPSDGAPSDVAPLEVARANAEGERRRITDYLADVSRLEAELSTERRQNEELRSEVAYQRRRIEREEEARLQLMQLLDNSQRLLGNAQRHTQHLLGGNEAEIFTMALPAGSDNPAEAAAEAETPAPQPKPRRRWWSWG